MKTQDNPDILLEMLEWDLEQTMRLIKEVKHREAAYGQDNEASAVPQHVGKA